VQNANGIVSGHLETIAILRRAVGGGKLNSADATAASDFLAGIEMALPAHTHLAYTIFECSREIRNKAAAAAAA
jgi:hypothetical protein